MNIAPGQLRLSKFGFTKQNTNSEPLAYGLASAAEPSSSSLRPPLDLKPHQLLPCLQEKDLVFAFRYLSFSKIIFKLFKALHTRVG
jgi:hypothetical protein